MLKKEINRILLADSYKYTHALGQYPSGAKNLYDYAEARSTKVYDKTLFVGLQSMLKEYFATPITKREVDEAEIYAMFHGIGFDRIGWDVILNEYDGYIPVTIKAVREGTLLPNKNVMFTITLTKDDERILWVVSWLETFLMKVWYPCNVGTRSFYVKKMLIQMGMISDENTFVEYQYHNFGDRGSSSVESAAIGGYAHLTCFNGTDNFNSLKYTILNYNVPSDLMGTVAHSIDASEHSTVTSWGRNGERNFVMNFLEINKNKSLIACVGDSYDVYEFTNMVTSGEFKQKIESEYYPTFVIRPDSGDAIEVINKMLDIMEKNNVLYDVNNKGYKIFKKYRIIWGDGINMETMRDILNVLLMRKYSTQNMAFGSGGWLMQAHNRDLLGFAIKCSEITLENGEFRKVSKDPITAPNKKSKEGKVTTYYNKRTGEYFTDLVHKVFDDCDIVEVLEDIFINGKLINEYTIFEIRDYVNTQLMNEIQKDKLVA